MKYKVGDKVKIRSWDSIEQEYGLAFNGHIKGIGFMLGMKKWCEKIVTIKEIWINDYIIKESGWYWTDEMIDHDATRILSIIYRLEMLKSMIKNNVDKVLIDEHIRHLKSNSAFFNIYDVNYYNYIFRKIKAGKKPKY